MLDLQAIRDLGIPLIEDEDWLPFPGFETSYLISSQGRVVSLPRVTIRKNGKPLTTRGKLLKASPSKGYPRVSLSERGAISFVFVHQALLRAFEGECPPEQEVRHLDGNPLNCTRENLAYGTRAQNIDDAKRHGTFPVLEQRPGAKLTRAQAIEIASSIRRVGELARAYGVSPSCIHDIRVGRSWEAVTREVRRKTYPRGACKLQEAEAQAILDDPHTPATVLARRYGISPFTVRNIRKRRAWRHLQRTEP